MMAAPDLLTGLLKDVSRSFYLTLRVLPAAIRSQIGLAYLLARATDTIADTEIVPVEERLKALEQLRERILGRSAEALDFKRFLGSDPDPSPADSERVLLQRIEEALSALAAFASSDVAHIRQVLDVITGGQLLDLQRFEAGRAGEEAGGRPVRVIALETEAELDDYTYRVAGCVGEFWTRMCRDHLFPTAPVDEEMLTKNGIRFGKGLQLVNILRDIPKDLAKGRCYLPRRQFPAGVTPENLLDPACEPKIRFVYDQWLSLAEAHLAAGWTYTNALPRRLVRVRLACAWPILIGMRTLALLRTGRVLDPANRIRISRADVREILLGTVLRLPFPGAWHRQFDRARGLVADAPRRQ